MSSESNQQDTGGKPGAVDAVCENVCAPDTELGKAGNGKTVLMLIARIRELEAVAAVAYDLTHEEGALSLQVGDTVEAEDLDQIERQSAALLAMGRLYKKRRLP